MRELTVYIDADQIPEDAKRRDIQAYFVLYAAASKSDEIERVRKQSYFVYIVEDDETRLVAYQSGYSYSNKNVHNDLQVKEFMDAHFLPFVTDLN